MRRKRSWLSFLAASPGSPRALLSRGRLQFLRGDYRGCIENLRRSFETVPRKSAMLLAAESYRRLGDNSQAQRRREQADRLPEPPWADPYFDEVSALRTGLKAFLVQADVAYGQNRVDESISILRRTVKDYPDSDWAKILLGRALIKKRDLPEAEKVLREALRLSPDSVEAHFRLGVAFYLQKNYRDAAARFQKAASLKPDFTMAHANLGFCLTQLGDPKGAIEAYRSAVRCEPDSLDAHKALAGLLLRYGDPAETQRHLELALKLNPNDNWARSQLQRLRQKDSQRTADP